jgi:hypothetical protein
MPGKGKYTQYVPPKSARRSFMEKLFKGSPFAELDETQAAAEAATRGNKYLTPSLQQGNPKHFPEGVHLDFKNPNSPKFSEVDWKKAGDPASPWFPDLSSPGAGPAGQVNLAPNPNDPEISLDDVKPNYVPGVPGTTAEGGTGTVDPTEALEKIAANAVLGKDFALGSSQKA